MQAAFTFIYLALNNCQIYRLSVECTLNTNKINKQAESNGKEYKGKLITLKSVGAAVVDEPSSSQWPRTHECMTAQLRLWIIFKKKK